MAQEYFINDQTLEDKVRQLLPSQGGAGAGFDLSASTQIIPIIDLTESAEGSNVRQDLQVAGSLVRSDSFDVTATSTTIITTTGYWKIDYNASIKGLGSAIGGSINITDGVTTKSIFVQNVPAGTDVSYCTQGVVTAFLAAGQSINVFSSSANVRVCGSFRQIADIDGNLTPLL